ncbi:MULTISPECIES: hypothetical protein [Planktothricoides]|uniref:Uncharacterized protein n=2 Tax=Planktothricoides raciborskii TaxID=132608 RepID=A0AAU8JE35_9CYAN|nr:MULTISPECIES: hypothetical protein [Planktothricoides]KOR34619.1 hypothetical protein AM228_22995 [Planktothricoides sp. SR001]MBD2544366.1 hypothetical protein [Planktothricoides raciborskii FACHB-1370]MBD2582213.1 hypothetical protein [Planktothricoides raciborskii FACHB-1261]
MKRKQLWFIGLAWITSMLLIFSTVEPSTSAVQNFFRAAAPASPGVSVAPATTSNPPAATLSAPTLPLSEAPYKDPQGRFEVGILENYKVSAIPQSGSPSRIADAPLIESPDGNLAYTVVVQAKITTESFTNEALAQMASNQFQRGEGFQPNQLKILSPGEILIPWTGSLTIGKNKQPITGEILVRQNQDQIIMLLVSATEDAKDNIPSAIGTLSDSLKSL